MYGGIGHVTFNVYNALDVVVENAGEGTDTTSLMNWTLQANFENLTLTGTDDLIGTGSAVVKVLIANNVLHGLQGHDSLYGGAGNATLDAGLGVDSMAGGSGDDTYCVNAVTDIVVENSSGGIDTLIASISYSLATNGVNAENLILATGALNGNFNDNTITGNALANLLTGGAGNDTLDGGSGADSLVGGAGDDTYFVDTALDTIVEDVGGGYETVNSATNFTLSSTLRALVLTGLFSYSGTGSTNDNPITGNAGSDYLYGMEGYDTLYGGAGTSADTLDGGIGNDTYIVDNVGDATVEVATGGTDVVNSTITWALGQRLKTWSCRAPTI